MNPSTIIFAIRRFFGRFVGNKFEFKGYFYNEHGQKCGQWIEQHTNGDEWEGPVVAGKKHGWWVVRRDNGVEGEGHFVENKQHGHWVFRDDNGIAEEGPFVDGKKHGQWVVRMDNIGLDALLGNSDGGVEHSVEHIIYRNGEIVDEQLFRADYIAYSKKYSNGEIIDEQFNRRSGMGDKIGVAIGVIVLGGTIVFSIIEGFALWFNIVKGLYYLVVLAVYLVIKVVEMLLSYLPWL